MEYILQRFGHEKFLDLCCTCREATFADDVQRVLGLSLDELDSAYQQDLARRQMSAKESLLSAKLADGVDTDRWQRLVGDLCSGMERLRAASGQSSITVVDAVDNTDEDGQTKTYQHRYEYYVDGERFACSRRFPEYSDLRVSTPDVDFGLKRKRDEESWRLNGYSVRNRRSEVEMPRSHEKPMFLWYPPPWWPYGPGLTITGMREDDADSQLVRVSFVKTSNEGGKWARHQGWLDLDPKRDCSVVEMKGDGFDEKESPTSSTHVRIDYETVDGIHVPKTIWQETHGVEGGQPITP